MKSRLNLIVVALAAAGTLFSSVLTADSATYTSGKQQVSLVELYTSEGCSSCPPADNWMSDMTSDKDLWAKHVPLAFHVDYWDYIGWKDLFADKDYTNRQHRHAMRLGMRTVYTPGVFLNGLELRRWRQFTPDIRSDENPGVLTVMVNDRVVDVDFMQDDTNTSEPLTVTVALLGFGLETSVERGENAGRVLEHDFVVLGLSQARLRGDTDSLKASLELPNTTVDAPRYGVAAWVSGRDDTSPLQATGGWLADIGR